MIVDTKISELPELNVSLIDETTFMPVVIGVDPTVNRSINVKEFIENIVIQGQTGLTETDPVYKSEKSTLALKTDLNNYALTTHTHSDYVEKEAGKSLISDTEIVKLVSYPTIETGNTTEFVRADGQLAPVDLSTLLTKTEAANTYSPTGHTHSQYLTGYTETEPAFNASIAKNITTSDTANWDSKQEELVSGENIKTINDQSILGSGNLTLTGITFIEQDPIYEAEKHLYSLTGHSHDDRYYTENEIDNFLLNKSNTGHTHPQYLTGETEPAYNADKASIALKTDLNGYSVTGHTHGQYLTSETDPVYESEKDTLALKTDLDNYSLTGHIHNQYLTGFTETDPIYQSEKYLYSLTGHTHPEYLTEFTETDPIYQSEKSTLALKTELNNYALSGHTHNQYLTGFTETDPIYESEKHLYSLTGHTHDQYLTAYTETDPIYQSEKSSLALKTDLDNYSLTGHTHNQYLTGFTETDPIYQSEKYLYSLTGHTHSQYLTEYIETDPIYQSEKAALALKTDLNDYALSGHTHTNYFEKSGGTVSGNVTIAGNLIVTGSTYETDVETLKIADAYITLRNGAIGGLGAGEYTGIEAVNYDGINSGRLVFDNQGIARVGDVGSEQPLATREETPTDDGIAIWDSLTNKFETVTLKLSDVSLTGHTHNQYLTAETDPVYTSEKSTLALKTDLDNYSLTGHTHSQYLTEFTETDPVYESEKYLYSLTGHTHSQYLTAYTETDPIYTSEKSTLALKTDLNSYSLTGHTHGQYLTSETDPVYESEKYLYSLTGHTHSQYLTGFTETDPIYTSEKSTLALKTDLDSYSLTGHTHGQYLTSETDPVYTSEKSTLALKTDLEDYLNLSGGTVSGSITATSFVKSGGLSTEFLMADGSVSTGGGSGSASLWSAVTGTRVNNTSFTIADNVTAYVGKGLIFQWKESGVIKCAMVNSSSYSSPNTTVNIVGDIMASIDSGTLKYCMLPMETVRFAIAGVIGNVSTNVANTFYANQPYRVLGSDLQVGTAGTTNSTTIDINKAGTTMFTTKPTLATTVAFSPSTFTANSGVSLALGDKVTIDIDAVQTTPATDLYVQLYVFPTRILYQN